MSYLCMRPESACIHNFRHNENLTLHPREDNYYVRQTVAPQRGAWITEAIQKVDEPTIINYILITQTCLIINIASIARIFR